MTTAEIINKAAESDPVARGQIYSEFRDFVWHVCLGIARDSYVAEDIASEVFITVFRKIKSFKFKSAFKSWLYRIAVNTALNHIKKLKRQRTRDIEDYLPVYPREHDDIYENMENKNTVSSLMAGMDEKSSMILMMREVEGMSYADIAESLGANISTVKTWIHRAREELRQIYLRDMGLHEGHQDKTETGGERDG